jgi:hypothetical protein
MYRLFKVAGNMTHEAISALTDDGMTQVVTARSRASRRSACRSSSRSG